LKIWLLAIFFLISACSTNSLNSRLKKGNELISGANFSQKFYTFDNFEILAAYKLRNADIINIYIEGDGFAWASKNRISSNPTPKTPVSLEIANIDSLHNKSSSVAWIGRPCQYLNSLNCENKYWTSHRFSNEVIVATNKIIDHLKNRSNSTKVNMIGFSGGAAIALLVATLRDDINLVVTISGNLDHEKVNKYHGVSLLSDSLNPIDYLDKLRNVSQKHFVGANDEIIPSDMVKEFDKNLSSKCSSVSIIEKNNHVDGWTQFWKNNSRNILNSKKC